MNPADFRAASAGRVVRTLQGYDAFVPAPLPPELSVDNQLFLATSRADAALSELAGVGRLLPNPHLLIAPFLRKEAVLSSRIEGTHTNLAELLRGEVEEEEDRSPSLDPDFQEVHNYVTALEYGIDRLKTLPLSLRLVRELHERLMTGVRGKHSQPGSFRVEQNFIGSRRSTVFDAAYVPPPPDELQGCLRDWERYLHERDSLPDLIQCALTHEQFEAIHPFLDGNGRLGRLLITLFLMERGRMPQPLLYLSAYFEAHRQEYYDRLQAVRTDGDWNGWLYFFLEGVIETARRAAEQATQLIEMREAMRAELRRKPKAVTLIDHLFINPYLTVKRAQRILECTDPTARSAIDALVQEKILHEVTERKWRRVYVCRPILDVFEPPDPAATS